MCGVAKTEATDGNDYDAGCRNLCSKKTDEDEEVEKTHESKLEVHFFSFTTFYYLVSSLVNHLLIH